MPLTKFLDLLLKDLYDGVKTMSSYGKEVTEIADEVLLPDHAHLPIEDSCGPDKKSEEIPWLKNLSDDHEISPFVARELHISVGWTMTFRKEEGGFV